MTPRRILIVEDDPAALRLASYTLERAGYEVLSADNGYDGLRKADDERPDLVVLDVMLPGVDGFEVCYRLRARATPESPMPAVLMLTAKSQESDRTMSKHVGADAYLAKPATPQELLNLVESLLAERYAA